MQVCPSCGAENRDEARFCDVCGAALAAEPARESRKTVTVLFCDVTGSTALGERIDPESLRNVMARYFETAKEAIERHGGTVEKFIGDAVMAVFGVPVVHEDDALRAVRAAADLRSALVPLNEELEQRFQTRLQLRTGVNTGEVVTGTEERLATGDAVNVAARLEQAAQPGEILLGEETLSLVRGAVEVEPFAPVEAKGKSEPLAAYKLVGVDQESAARAHIGPMVGRERQRHVLEESFANVVADRTCHLFTVLGTAGVGKSRLASEFLDGLDGATVVSGRCLSYGEGISYFPVTEVAIQLKADPAEHAGLASILGDDDASSSPDEIAWAFRKLLEQRAGEGPVVVVFDDIHWGEPAFLDLVEHVADFSREAPILLLCMARPELLDRRQSWGGGKLNATNVLLEPLGTDEAAELLARLLPAQVEDGLRNRILDAAGGNPLFVEEMVAMVAERQTGNGELAEITVPPTIQALLAARLDQLDPHERVVLERGSVEGNVFHRGVVEALAPDEREVPRQLMSLVRKELVRPDRSQLSGDDAFRFRHLLIRDAAYDALPKGERADLHQSFAAWLEEHGAELVELDEILGYHLEQAWRYRTELGAASDPELMNAARTRLEAAARRAMLRDDWAAALNLIDRALALVPEGEIDLLLETDRLNTVFYSGEVQLAYEAAGALGERAAAHGDRIAERAAAIERTKFATFVNPEGAADELERLVNKALPEFEEAGDSLALYVGYFGQGAAAHLRGRMDEGREAMDRASALAEGLGLPHLQAWVQPYRVATRFHGTTPLVEVIAWTDEQEAAGFSSPILQNDRALGLAMLGRFDEARARSKALQTELEERGSLVALALLLGMLTPETERLAGDPAAALAASKRGCQMFEEAGERSWLSSALGIQGQALYELGDLDAAFEAAGRGLELGASDDAYTQILSRGVQAKVLARRGSFGEAERLAREACELADATDMPAPRGGAYEDLAHVLYLAGKPGEAERTIERAVEIYDAKGAVAMSERARRVAAELRA
ncbi:MAG: adenylate/guanylate cyclase domain-containing protein [Candidatus Doudnabacteria bacterium]